MTPRLDTVVRRAPGKLFVVGEFAVVEPGAPAILVAVDRYVTVTVTVPDDTDTDVVISTDLGASRVRRRWHHGRLRAGDDEPTAGLAHVVSAIEVVGRLLAERGVRAPAMCVTVSSALHDNGTKLGLGSSGAVTVATVAAVTSFCGLELSADTRFRLAVLATVGIDARASCGDLAASTWGGWLAYRSPDRAAVLDLLLRRGVEETLRARWPGFAVRRLPPPGGLSLEVGWTGTPATSSAMVADLYRRPWRGGESHRRFVATTADCVRASVSALERGDHHALQDQIRRARQELTRLDDETGLGVFTTGLTRLCEVAEAFGGAAKPSGAGGGDCGIALLAVDAARDIAHVRGRWAEVGIRHLPIRPTVERNGNDEPT
jgi:phosphomevalonate kinase